MNVPTSFAEYAEIYPGAQLEWIRLTGSPRFDYPIDYSVAILYVDDAGHRLDFLSRWQPNSYCHHHRHVGQTSLLVLEGEHHVVETTDTETVHKIRRPGYFSINPGGDVHMEYGGPEGTLVYFSCNAIDGRLFDILDEQGNVIKSATVEDFVSGAL